MRTASATAATGPASQRPVTVTAKVGRCGSSLLAPDLDPETH